MSLIARLGRGSASGWFGVVFGLGLVCALPVLGARFYTDDYVQLAKLRAGGTTGQRAASLFTFVEGGAETRRLIGDGTLPWWTTPELRVRFFRPLSAGLMVADHALFGLQPLGYHLHSLLWWLAWLGGTALLFRRIFSPQLGLLAFFVFAVDDSHWLPIGWIAGRNATVAMACVVWGVLAYLRYRDDGWRPGLTLALGAWSLSLLAGEVAMSGLTYVVAYELLRDPGGGDGAWGARLRRLWPVGLLLAGYAVLYGWSGSGVRGSGAYVDPIHETTAFIAALARRGPAQFGALIFGAPLDLWLLTPLQLVFVAVGLVAFVVTVPWFLAATRALPAPDRIGGRWLALGAALSLIPTSAGLLGERSLAAGSVGAAVMVAVLLRHGWARRREVQGLRRIAFAVGVAALAIPNLVVAAPWLVTKLLFLNANGSALEHVAATADAAAPAPARAVLLWSDDVMIGSYTPIIARLAHPGALASFRVLAMASVDLLMTRVAPDTLELSCLDGALLTSEWERLFRADNLPLSAGATVSLDGLTVEIVKDDAGRPSRVRFRFDAPLDDPSLRFLEWRGRRLVPAALPAMGETRSVFRSPPLLAAGAD
jgi:hypothetical protein